MGLFQVLSTMVEPGGWMDMNILTPFGIVSVELQLDEESVRSFRVSDCLCSKKNNQTKKNCRSEDELIASLLDIAESLAGQNNTGAVEPFRSTSHVRFNKDLSEQ